jgi:hypothetical protein
MTTDAYQRMLDWCHAAATQQTVIPGTRTITHMSTGKPGEREKGTIDNPDFAGQDWLGDNVQQVIDLMDDSLGAIPEGDYRIVEMAG